MKSSTRKRIGLGVGILLIGGIGGYLLGNHQFHKRVMEERFYDRPFIYDSMNSDFKHRQRHMQDMFNDFERDFFDEYERMDEDLGNSDFDFKDFKELTGDSKAQGVFHYYKKTSNDGKDTSYNVDGKWNDSDKGGRLIMSGVNEEGKEFSYSGTIHNGKSEGVITNGDGNSKSLKFKQLDLKEIYDDSNDL